MKLNTGTKFSRQFKQPFENKDCLTEIFENKLGAIIIRINTSKHSVVRKLSDELMEAMMCESSEYIDNEITMYDPDYGMFDIEELKQFISEFMQEYNVNIIYKI
jgi:hypothetical protein